MKYINPGFPQLFEYSVLSPSSIGEQDYIEKSKTGHYIILSMNNEDYFYKHIDNTNEIYLLFDLSFYKSANNILSIEKKFFDIYDETLPFNNIYMTYKQHTTYKFDIFIYNFENKCLGSIRVNTNTVNTIELHIKRNELTIIEIYSNGVIVGSFLDETIGEGIFNRFTFYNQYSRNLELCLSHIIYSDEQRINNERIKMLKTDNENVMIPTGAKERFVITETLSDTIYNNIKNFGIVSVVNNISEEDVKIQENINDIIINSYNVRNNTTEYTNTVLKLDPRDNEQFKPENITNMGIVVQNNKVIE